MDFGFEKIMEFAMNIDKLHLANLVVEVIDEIIWSSRFFYLQNNFSKGQTALFFAVRKYWSLPWTLTSSTWPTWWGR